MRRELCSPFFLRCTQSERVASVLPVLPPDFDEQQSSWGTMLNLSSAAGPGLAFGESWGVFGGGIPSRIALCSPAEPCKGSAACRNKLYWGERKIHRADRAVLVPLSCGFRGRFAACSAPSAFEDKSTPGSATPALGKSLLPVLSGKWFFLEQKMWKCKHRFPLFFKDLVCSDP